MSDENDIFEGSETGTVPDRRALMRLAGLGAAAIVTIRPAIAQAATSVLNCQIPVPDPGRAGSYIAPGRTGIVKLRAACLSQGRDRQGRGVGDDGGGMHVVGPRADVDLPFSYSCIAGIPFL